MRFDADSRARIYRTVGTFFGFDGQSLRSTLDADRRATSGETSREPHFSTREEISPKDFLLQKQPRSEVDRVTCIAYYLMHYRGMHHFKTTDVNKLNTEAAQIKLSNASSTVNNAMRRGLLVTATRGTKQLSAQGEKYVEALPDQAAAKNMLSTVRSPRSRKKSGRKSTN